MDFGYLDALIEADLPEIAGQEEMLKTATDSYRHVWVLVEANKQGILPASLAALGQGRDIADQIGVYLYALLCGHALEENLAAPLVAYGADQVLLVDDPALAVYQVENYTTALTALVKERRPEILLLAATPLGNDLAPRLAQRLETGLISHCVQLGLDMAERQLLGTVARMQGDYFHTLACPQARPQLATLEPGAFQLPYLQQTSWVTDPATGDSGSSERVERLAAAIGGPDSRLAWLEMDTAVIPAVKPLAEAPVIVAAGRGLGDAAGFALAEALAAALGGQVAGSRGALDEGWITVEQQVGITGQSVKPDLYIACGISGAIQHLVGMQDARFVLAINRDEHAPIMARANLAAVGDVKAIMNALLAALS